MDDGGLYGRTDGLDNTDDTGMDLYNTGRYGLERYRTGRTYNNQPYEEQRKNNYKTKIITINSQKLNIKLHVTFYLFHLFTNKINPVSLPPQHELLLWKENLQLLVR